jgi:hypothetical protein
MSAHIALFVQRSEDGHETTDTLPLKMIECVTCPWYVSYVEELWTSNAMPERERSAFFEVGAHARSTHRSVARIVRGWRT